MYVLYEFLNRIATTKVEDYIFLYTFFILESRSVKAKTIPTEAPINRIETGNINWPYPNET